MSIEPDVYDTPTFTVAESTASNDFFLDSFCPERAETNAVQGCIAIFKGIKPLKMKESRNRIFRFRSRNEPWKVVSGRQLDNLLT
jgi:hypothetical protein